MTKYNSWTKYKNLFIGIVCVLAFAVIFVSFIFYASKVTAIYYLEDYGCDNVARMYAYDKCVLRQDARLFSQCFSKDALKFWYDNNCREPDVSVVSNGTVLCSTDTSTGLIVVTGDSRSFSGCTIVVNNDSTQDILLRPTGVEPDASILPLIVNHYSDCCYPSNCYNSFDEYRNDSCNHNCEYMVLCYDTKAYQDWS